MADFFHHITALDSRFSVQRSARGVSNALYMRRRGQLLQETLAKSKAPKLARTDYFNVRQFLLIQRYGHPGPRGGDSLRQSLEAIAPTTEELRQAYTRTRSKSVPGKPSKRRMTAGSSRAASSLRDLYSFSGMHCIFDHHKAAVTNVAFAPGESELLAFSSQDGTITIARVGDRPTVLHILEGHRAGITGLEWAITGSMLVSVSVDRTIRLWHVGNGDVMKTVHTAMDLLACALCPRNNSLLLVGTGQGIVATYNISVGKVTKGGLVQTSGPIKAVVFNDQGSLVWTGGSKGVVQSYRFDITNGKLSPLVRVTICDGHAITSLRYIGGLAGEPRPCPLLLLSCRNNTLYLLSVTNPRGVIRQRQVFPVRHVSVDLRSTFATWQPGGAYPCVATGSEDGVVLLYEVTCGRPTSSSKVLLNQLQGHSVPVLCVAWNGAESLLATADSSGQVMVWKRNFRGYHTLTMHARQPPGTHRARPSVAR